MSKKDQLTEAIKVFEVSKRTPEDYLDLFVVSNRCLKQGSGLLWEDVRAATCDALYGKGNWGHFRDEGPHWSDKPMCDKSNYPG